MTKPNSFQALRENIRLAEIKRRLKAAFRKKQKPAPRPDEATGQINEPASGKAMPAPGATEGVRK